jgi:predicted ATPase
MITALRVEGYRSVRETVLDLGPLNVLTGPNGCGKSNLYRAVYLLHAAASGTLARTLADEGGMPSVLWAGPRKRHESRELLLGVRLTGGFSYTLRAGLPEANALPEQYGFFKLDPLIKEETVHFEGAALLERGKNGVVLRDDSGKRVSLPMSLTRSESVFTQIAEPHRYPYLVNLRDTLQRWRFYHHFRTDEGAPLRQPQVGTFTPALAHDGRDLAAALATLLELGDPEMLHLTIRRALNGAELKVVHDSEHARFRVQLQTPGLLRPLEAAELSDGTLRFLCLVAALLSPRLPPLLALNEPETSLHPDLLPALAELIVAASTRAQLWVVTHSTRLAEEIERLSGVAPVRLALQDGATLVK